MKHEMLTRAQVDGRIRGAARVATCFCWAAALVAPSWERTLSVMPKLSRTSPAA